MCIVRVIFIHIFQNDIMLKHNDILCGFLLITKNAIDSHFFRGWLAVYVYIDYIGVNTDIDHYIYASIM
jgi:hypothetical protein